MEGNGMEEVAGSFQVVDFMEREMGLEPTTSSLGKRLSIDNREHGVFVDPVPAMEFTRCSF
jgi:hypothetical protein